MWRSLWSAYGAAKKQGIEVFPVWNKSNREHRTVHTEPPSLRVEADAAVKALGWTGKYFVNADHISLANVDGFIEASQTVEKPRHFWRGFSTV